MNYSIPVYKPFLRGNEKKYVIECLDSSWISSKGKFISEFENKFSSYIGIKYGTAVSNGTVALHLALLALGIRQGDEVIVPTLTYIASVNAIYYTGANPVFVDADLTSWQSHFEDIKAKVTSHTKAIMAVHLYGGIGNMEQLSDFCHSKGIYLIEDCAEAIGSYYNGKHAGTFGDIATFSFFGNKTITTGEGGMVVSNDPTLHDRVVHLKGQGLAKFREYWHDIIGYNYRMTNLCAAIGIAQLEQIDIILQKKEAIHQQYISKVINPSIVFQGCISGANPCHWMNSILVKNPEDRDPLRIKLAENGIETRPLFYPIHTMPMYDNPFQRHPVAENISWRGINLPSFPELTEQEINLISNIINNF